MKGGTWKDMAKVGYQPFGSGGDRYGYSYSSWLTPEEEETLRNRLRGLPDDACCRNCGLGVG